MTKLEDLTLEVIQSRKVFGRNNKGIAEAVSLTENMLRIHIRDINRVLRTYEYDRDNLEDIASDLNISKAVSEIVLDYYTPGPLSKIGKRILKKQLKKEKYGLIDLAIECGAETIVEISELTGLNYLKVQSLVKENEGYKGKIKSTRESTISKIKSLVLEGVTDVNEIAEKLSRQPSGIYKLSLKEKIPITSTPIFKVKKRNHYWDELIKEGLTLLEIGNEVRKTPERVRQYINGTDQYEIWIDAKESKKVINKNNTNVIKLKEGRNILLDIIRQTIENRVMNIPDNPSPEEFADKYLGKYILSDRKRRFPIKSIFKKIDISDRYNLFMIYKEAKDHNEKISLAEFEKRTGISFVQVGRIFERVGLKTMVKDYSGRKTRIKF